MTRPAHQVTTRHLGAAYPFAPEPGLGAPGVLVGRDLLGGPFVYDPFELYKRGSVTNPNMVVFGQIGRGKSAFVKSYLWRQALFGRRAWVVDPKGEYGSLARAWGVIPLALRPGGPLRLNPLEAVQGVEVSAVSRRLGIPHLSADAWSARTGTADEMRRRRSELLASIGMASLGRPLLPSERAALDLAVVKAGPAATLPLVVQALLEPDRESARSVGTDAAGLAADGRQVALELRRLVTGDLRGMFDGPTTPGVSLDGPLVVLDLSAVYHSAALGILMTCAAAWLNSALGAAGPPADCTPDGPSWDSEGEQPGACSASGIITPLHGEPSGPVVLVVDEAWAILGNLAVARWLQASWKLSRALGVANIAVLHRVSDLAAAGPVGSEQAGLAAGLLADSETRVIYGQSPGEVEHASSLLGLSPTEAELVARLRRGVALWKVGRRSFLVEHLLASGERRLVDTDGRMVGGPRAGIPGPGMRLSTAGAGR
ncbi:MAG: ATP-binding protein [Acidimicrobiales bacterium]